MVLGFVTGVITPLVINEDFDEGFLMMCLIMWPFVVIVGLFWLIGKIGRDLYRMITRKR